MSAFSAIRCHRSRQLIGKAPWKTTTFVAGLRRNRISAPLVLEGAMNGQSFLTYLETILAPSLSAGDIVVMDKSPGPQGRRRAIADRSRQRDTDLPSTLFPDLDPIEVAFAKLKELLRKAAVRTPDALWDSIDAVLTAFTPHECASYFRYARYAAL